MAWFNLGRALNELGWSMRKFAKELGVAPQVVSRYFREGYDPPSSTLLMWAEVLECSLDDLLDPNLDENKKLMPRPESAIQAHNYRKRRLKQ